MKYTSYKSILGKMSVIFLFTFIIVFAIFNSRNLFRGTVLSIENLKDGQTFTEPFLTINGTVKNARSLSINNADVLLTENKTFSYPLLLLPGYNVLEVKSGDKFGKIEKKVFHITLKEPVQFIQDFPV